MRRICVLGLASIFAVSSCSNDEPSLTLDGVETVAPSTITACTNVPYAPFEFRDGDTLKGIDVDLVNAVASDLGATAQFKEVDFETIFEGLADNECDLVASSISITPEREAEYLFSDGYFEVNQSLLVRAEDNAIANSTLDSVEGGIIGVQSQSTGADYVEDKAPDAQVTEYENSDEMIQALIDGEINGVVQDFPVNSFKAQSDPRLRVVQTFTDVDREQYGFAFAKDNVGLRDLVNQSLDLARSDGRYDQILSDYLGMAADSN